MVRSGRSAPASLDEQGDRACGQQHEDVHGQHRQGTQRAGPVGDGRRGTGECRRGDRGDRDRDPDRGAGPGLEGEDPGDPGHERDDHGDHVHRQQDAQAAIGQVAGGGSVTGPAQRHGDQVGREPRRGEPDDQGGEGASGEPPATGDHPMQVAHSGHRSGLIAIAPTIRMLFLVSTPKAAITPAQAMYVRYWGTALAYCRDAAARSAHANGPPPQEGRSPGWAAASGRLPSVCSTVISSPDTPAAISKGRTVSTACAAMFAVTRSASPAAVGPTTTRWSTPACRTALPPPWTWRIAARTPAMPARRPPPFKPADTLSPHHVRGRAGLPCTYRPAENRRSPGLTGRGWSASARRRRRSWCR